MKFVGYKKIIISKYESFIESRLSNFIVSNPFRTWLWGGGGCVFCFMLIKYLFHVKIRTTQSILILILSSSTVALMDLVVLYVKKNRDGTSFSINGIDKKYRRKHVHISWEDMEVIEIKHGAILNYMTLRFSSKRNSEMSFIILVDWFREKSILRLAKKYAPQDHVFYKIISEHAARRNIYY